MTKGLKGGRSKQPEEMTYAEAIAKLFPDHDQNLFYTPELPSKPWVKPRAALPIDDFISALKNGSESAGRARLISRDLAKERNIICPYWSARMGVANAVMVAHWSKEEVKCVKERKKRLDENVKKLVKEEERLNKLTNDLSVICFDFLPFLQRGLARADHEEVEKISNSVEIATTKLTECAEALRVLASFVKKESIRTKRDNRADEWAWSFCESLGYTWEHLTAEVITSRTTPFENFVVAAYQSLGRDEDIEFENAINESLKRVSNRPYWDKFNKYRDAITPPAVDDGTITLEAFKQEWYEFTIGTYESRRHEILSEMSENNPNYRKAKDMLFDLYSLLTPAHFHMSIGRGHEFIKQWEDRARSIVGVALSEAHPDREAAKYLLDAFFKAVYSNERAFVERLGYRPPGPALQAAITGAETVAASLPPPKPEKPPRRKPPL
jgi:hypothetical protein